jgi:hypothetical protein
VPRVTGTAATRDPAGHTETVMLVEHLLPGWMPDGAEFVPRCWCWRFLDCNGTGVPGVYVPDHGYYCFACAARYWRPELAGEES